MIHVDYIDRGNVRFSAIPRTRAPQKRNLTAIDGILVLIGTLLIIQMWLLTAALESFLAVHQEGAALAAVISGLIFMGCAGLYFFVERLDAERDVRAGEGPVALPVPGGNRGPLPEGGIVNGP